MLEKFVKDHYQKSLKDCSNEEIYIALLELVKEQAKQKESHAGKKKVYYISAEFLIGKLLSNNLINLGLFDTVKVFMRLRRLSRSHRWEMVDWDVWQRVSWILLRLLGFRETALVSTITWDFLSRYLSRICRRNILIHGLRKIAG